MAQRVERDVGPLLTQAERDALARAHLPTFALRFFPLVAGGRPLILTPYLQLFCANLQAVVEGRTQNLIVNLPPRHVKSLIASVLLPAFYLGHHPGKEVMCVSYGQDLARTFAGLTREVMNSADYKSLFPTRLLAGRASIHDLRTRQGGARRATSIDGVATGKGADLIIFDDPQKPGEVLSDAVRASSNAAFENTFLSRRNDPATARMVVVMQRLHEDDFVGHVQARGLDWSVLRLPAVAEEDEAIGYRTLWGERTFRRKAGGALSPELIPRTELDRIRNGIGEANWAAQYQQRPAPVVA